jgi:hypothetical protein
LRRAVLGLPAVRLLSRLRLAVRVLRLLSVLLRVLRRGELAGLSVLLRVLGSAVLCGLSVLLWVLRPAVLSRLSVLLRILRRGELPRLPLRRAIRLRLAVLLLAVGILPLLPVRGLILRSAVLAGLPGLLRRAVRLLTRLRRTRLTELAGLSRLRLAVRVLRRLSVRLRLPPGLRLSRLTELTRLLRCAIRLLRLSRLRLGVRLLSRLRLRIRIRRVLPVLRLCAVRLLLPRLPELAGLPLLRPTELRLSPIPRLSAVRLLTRLRRTRLPELARLRSLLLRSAELSRLSAIRLLTRLRSLLLRSAVRLLPLSLLLSLPLHAGPGDTGTSGAVRIRIPGEAGLLGLGAGLPRRRALAAAERRDGPLRGRRLRGLLLGARGFGPRRGAPVGVLGARNGPLGGLGLRNRSRGLRVRLGGCGFGRGVGHGPARYPTNPRLVTPARDLSPDCGVRYPAVHLARTTTEDAILSLQVCDF